MLAEIRRRIMGESVGLVVYEGRFGASPRELKQILHRAAQNTRYEDITPMTIFDELERLVKDRTVYEFLQFEPRGKYHDAAGFIGVIKDEFADLFEIECMRSMSLVADEEYDKLLTRYIENVVADVKKEKIFNSSTEQYEPANQILMREVEKILGVSGSVERHREGLLARMASWKIENKHAQIDVVSIFQDILGKIQEHYFHERKTVVQSNFQSMLALGTDEERSIDEKQKALARETYEQLKSRFAYSESAARDSLKFMLGHNKKRRK